MFLESASFRIPERKFRIPRAYRVELILLVAVLVIAPILLEALLGLFLEPFYPNIKYGWAHLGPEKSYEIIQDDINKTRNITIEYFENGFKRWGDVNSSKKKVLIIGDSFTEMKYVSNGEEWYSYLEDEFDIELFVYGTGGFGTLQEYMILDEHIDAIKPNIIIWQFYFNDFINNDFDADKNEYPFNNRAFRPYLENGGIVYRIPAKFSKYRNKSMMLDLALNSYDAIYTSNLKEKGQDYFYNNI